MRFVPYQRMSSFPEEPRRLSQSLGLMDQRLKTTFDSIRVALDDLDDTSTATKTISNTEYTLVASDVGKFLRFTAATTVTITVPPNVFEDGDEVTGIQAGAGQLLFVAGTNVEVIPGETMNSATLELGSPFALKFFSAYGAHLFGDLEET